MGKHDQHLPAVALSFAAGAASATIVWWLVARRHDEHNNEELKQYWFQRIQDLRSRAERTKWPLFRRVVEPPSGNGADAANNLTKTPVKPQDKTGLCIGSIFGMDVGGTLTKLVYFEQRTNESPHLQMPSETSQVDGVLKPRRTSSVDFWEFPGAVGQDVAFIHERNESLPDLSALMGRQQSSSDSVDSQNSNNGTTTKNVFDLTKSRDHAKALDTFYAFARGFSRFQSGVKDDVLSFYSRELGGDFHFIHFETRQMEAAMDLIRANKLHSNICEMGATGGGAHKFAASWERVLGITILKEEELDSLVAGMQFALSTVVGECYSFRARIQNKANEPPSNGTTSGSAGSRGRENKEPENATKSAAGKGRENEESSSDSDGDAEGKDEYHGDDWWWSRKVKRDSVSPSEAYPYLLVTIGTGVSILRVDGPRKHVRISGSTIGGGTYWGLIRLLTDVDDFENVLHLAEKGDPSKVDMMVGDIYGKDSQALEKIGLPSNLVASSFGKLVAKQDPANGLKQEDLARALLLMVTNNIGQVAYLNAQLSNTPRIYFVGNFLRHNKISQRRLAYAINYWSKGEMEALFLEHEGYLGAMGAFLLSQGISQNDSGFYQMDNEKTSQASKHPVAS